MNIWIESTNPKGRKKVSDKLKNIKVNCKECRVEFIFDYWAVEQMIYPQIICPHCSFDNVDPSYREPPIEEELKIYSLQNRITKLREAHEAIYYYFTERHHYSKEKSKRDAELHKQWHASGAQKELGYWEWISYEAVKADDDLKDGSK